jgi:NAD(P) transhydrogenase
MDALSSMANVAGYRAVVEASHKFGRFFTGQITAAGKVPPAKILVIGAGVAGLAAIGAARNMGAIVRAFDTRPAVKDEVKSLGGDFLMLDFEEEGAGSGGYAKVMSKEFIDAEMKLFAEQAEEVDIIITTAMIPGKKSPVLITEEMVKSMKPGSVIVDLAAEGGGNCELTETGRSKVEHGVTILGYTDLPSRLPAQSSRLYGNNLVKLVNLLGTTDQFAINQEDEIIRGALVLDNGNISWPPPKVEVSVQPVKPKEESIKESVEEKKSIFSPGLMLGGLCILLLAMGWKGENEFLDQLTVFVLACFVGYMVVWNVTPSLHTPAYECDQCNQRNYCDWGNAFRIRIQSLDCRGGDLFSHYKCGGRVSCNSSNAQNVSQGMSEGVITMAYLVSGVFFVLSLGGLSKQETARKGNMYGILGMTLAILATFLSGNVDNFKLLIPLMLGGALIGAVLAKRVEMTSMPELVAILHSFVGAAAVLVGLASFLGPEHAELSGTNKLIHDIEILLGVFIGGVTFTGSVVAFGKLRGSLSGKPLLLPGRHFLNLAMLGASIWLGAQFIEQGHEQALISLLIVMGISFVLGIHLIVAIGGADMPVVVSMLNSYSGWAAAAAGFMLKNDLLIITGALVGSSGAILSYIMCKAMNRSLANVIFGGFGTAGGSAAIASEIEGSITETSADEVAEELKEAKEVMIVPGYGMAVAQAQHVVKDITETLRGKDVNVRFAIHPVAGRLPGHMNVLLAEANVPYDIVFEMDEINDDLPDVDVLLVVGANDIVNPSALEDSSSPIAGMPVIEAWNAKSVVALKRSMAAGYSGVENPLYFKDNTNMLFGDAKDTLSAVFSKLS